MATVREGDAKGRCEKEAALLLTPPLALSAVRRVWKQRRREAGGGQGEQRYGGKASRQRRLKGYIKQVWMKCEEVSAFCRFSCYLLRYGTIFWYQHSIFAAWDLCTVEEKYKDDHGIYVMDAKFGRSCIISRLRHDNFNFSAFNERVLVLIRCFSWPLLCLFWRGSNRWNIFFCNSLWTLCPLPPTAAASRQQLRGVKPFLFTRG